MPWIYYHREPCGSQLHSALEKEVGEAIITDRKNIVRIIVMKNNVEDSPAF